MLLHRHIRKRCSREGLPVLELPEGYCCRLNSLIQTITEEARANIALVTQVNKRSETLKSLFNDIERLCKESSQLVNREHVTKLSRASYNIGETVRNAEDIIAIPSLALEAQKIIQEGQENEDTTGVDLVQSKS